MKKILYLLIIILILPLSSCEDSEFNVNFGVNFNNSTEKKLIGIWSGTLIEPILVIHHMHEEIEYQEFDVDYQFDNFGKGYERVYDWQTGDLTRTIEFSWEVRHGGIISIIFCDGVEYTCKDYVLDDYHFSGNFYDAQMDEYLEFNLTYQENK